MLLFSYFPLNAKKIAAWQKPSVLFYFFSISLYFEINLHSPFKWKTNKKYFKLWNYISLFILWKLKKVNIKNSFRNIRTIVFSFFSIDMSYLSCYFRKKNYFLYSERKLTRQSDQNILSYVNSLVSRSLFRFKIEMT